MNWKISAPVCRVQCEVAIQPFSNCYPFVVGGLYGERRTTTTTTMDDNRTIMSYDLRRFLAPFAKFERSMPDLACIMRVIRAHGSK